MTGLPAELRARTRRLHAALDASLPLVDPTLTRDTYTGFLSRMLAWLRPTERALDVWLTGSHYEAAEAARITEGAQRTFSSLHMWLHGRPATVR